jgi:SAM-dependent methyltransferase
VTVNGEQATSFGSVADSYDRVRPWPAPAAMDWLVPAGCEVAVDLAAGTGLFTRELLGRAARVTAVEPDARMRDVLARRSPEIEVRAGWGEAIPLPDGSADAVFVSTAWHWLDLPRAVPEIARVLRPGGRLAVLWTSRDRDEDWVAVLDLLKAGVAGTADPLAAADESQLAEVRAELERHHVVTLPAGSAFGPGETASFGYRRTMSVDDALAWLGTGSASITAAAADRETSLARSRDVLLTQVRAGAAGPDPLIEMPVRTWCWRAERADTA